MLRKWLLAMSCSAAAFASSTAIAPAATMVADNGFRPNPNGFSFQNYGNDEGIQNLTPAEMQQLFGARVCANQAGGKCNLIPPAQQWMSEQNQAMGGGHCQGFAVLSERLFKDQFPPLGTGPVFGYQIKGNASLQRAIAYAWVSQNLDSVIEARVKGTPNDILDKLKRALTPDNNETYTVAIYKPDGSGGHAVTPFAVEDQGGGKFALDIYDNNYPDETRQIIFDTGANTWSYNAAINPSAPVELYKGTAKNPQIELDPTTPAIGVQPCPFCGPQRGATRSRPDTIQLTGNLHYHAQLVISDSAGHRVGVVYGQIVNTFPGAQVQPTALNDFSDTAEPTYLVPSRNITMTVDGSALQHNDTETLSNVGPGQDLAVQGLKIGPGQKDVVRLMRGVANFSFTAARGKSSGSPLLRIGADSSKADVALTLKLVKLKPGSTVKVKLNAAKQAITFFAAGNPGTATYVLTAVTETKQKNTVESSKTIRLRGGNAATFSYGQ